MLKKIKPSTVDHCFLMFFGLLKPCGAETYWLLVTCCNQILQRRYFPTGKRSCVFPILATYSVLLSLLQFQTNFMFPEWPAVLGVTTCWIYASIGRERLAPRIPSNETSWDMRWYDHIQGFKVAMTWQAKPVPMPHLGGSLPSRAPRQAGSSELQTCFCLFPSYLLWMSLFSFHSICIW